MACVHNQALINAKMSEINIKQGQIYGLNTNIFKCNEIKMNHVHLNENINCVINNLESNYVVEGVPYDSGIMTNCLTHSNDTIKDCDDIIEQSKLKINLLNEEISILEAEIKSLDGDCSDCQDMYN